MWNELNIWMKHVVLLSIHILSYYLDDELEVLIIIDFMWEFIKHETLNYWHFTCVREYNFDYLIRIYLFFWDL